ncbi:MAG: hypothetical protein Kow0090_07750 [Myxococcota bacterium]
MRSCKNREKFSVERKNGFLCQNIEKKFVLNNKDIRGTIFAVAGKD